MIDFSKPGSEPAAASGLRRVAASGPTRVPVTGTAAGRRADSGVTVPGGRARALTRLRRDGDILTRIRHLSQHSDRTAGVTAATRGGAAAPQCYGPTRLRRGTPGHPEPDGDRQPEPGPSHGPRAGPAARRATTETARPPLPSDWLTPPAKSRASESLAEYYGMAQTDTVCRDGAQSAWKLYPASLAG